MDKISRMKDISKKMAEGPSVHVSRSIRRTPRRTQSNSPYTTAGRRQLKQAAVTPDNQCDRDMLQSSNVTSDVSVGHDAEDSPGDTRCSASPCDIGSSTFTHATCPEVHSD